MARARADDDTIADTSGAQMQIRVRPGLVAIATGGIPRLDVLAITKAGARLGRDPDADLVLDERASRDHASIRFADDRWCVRDLDSRNGTFVDGERIAGEHEATSGAIVRAGQTLVLLSRDVAPFEGSDVAALATDDGVVGPTLLVALAEIERAAKLGRVMIHGESGTGKELAARRFHAATQRTGQLVTVNCAALPTGLAESILFGSRKGAFSGAVQDRVGLIESAEGGTLLLDEIGELDSSIQAKLLRALEQHEVLPVGESRSRRVDFALCAATHRDLRADVAAGRFREDLYYRIARPAVVLPPLRERREDIPTLVVVTLRGDDASLMPHVRLLEACCVRPWPGNLRELTTEIRRAAQLALARGDTVVRVDDLAQDAGLELGTQPPDRPAASAPSIDPTTLTRDDVVAALVAAGSNVSAAARALGVHRTQLYRVMRRFDLE